jgi:hypothetical protein
MYVLVYWALDVLGRAPAAAWKHERRLWSAEGRSAMHSGAGEARPRRRLWLAGWMAAGGRLDGGWGRHGLEPRAHRAHPTCYLPSLKIRPRPPPGPAGGDAHATGSFMPSPLLSFAGNGRWGECHAILDRGEDDVNERDPVRSAMRTGLMQPLLAPA